MASLDGYYSPFLNYPGYSSMAPCMRSCNDDYGYNGCDNSGCWCKKENLDLRIGEMTRCASTGCTYANMNTQTDIDILSGIQVSYCVDVGSSPAGMTMPSTVEASPTNSSPAETGPAQTTTGTGATSRTRQTSGPAATGGASSGGSTQNNNGSDALSTAAKAGIGIGAAFCALLAILIAILLFRRRKPQQQYFAPPQNNFQAQQPPPMAPTPYSGNGPFSPPPLRQPAPIHIPPGNASAGFGGSKGDVSPIEEKAPALATVTRKEIGASTKHDVSPQGTPVPKPAQPASPNPTSNFSNAPTEAQGSVPPPRHEVGNDGEITNTITTRGSELDSNQRPPVNQYPGTGGYQESRQGPWAYNQYPNQGQAQAYEVDGGQGQWRQELPGQSRVQGQGGFRGQQYGGAYELGPGR